MAERNILYPPKQLPYKKFNLGVPNKLPFHQRMLAPEMHSLPTQNISPIVLSATNWLPLIGTILAGINICDF